MAGSAYEPLLRDDAQGYSLITISTYPARRSSCTTLPATWQAMTDSSGRSVPGDHEHVRHGRGSRLPGGLIQCGHRVHEPAHSRGRGLREPLRVGPGPKGGGHDRGPLPLHRTGPIMPGHHRPLGSQKLSGLVFSKSSAVQRIGAWAGSSWPTGRPGSTAYQIPVANIRGFHLDKSV